MTAIAACTIVIFIVNLVFSFADTKRELREFFDIRAVRCAGRSIGICGRRFTLAFALIALTVLPPMIAALLRCNPVALFCLALVSVYVAIILTGIVWSITGTFARDARSRWRNYIQPPQGSSATSTPRYRRPPTATRTKPRRPAA